MITLGVKERTELSAWLNDQGIMPSWLDQINVNSTEYTYIMTFTNLIGENIYDSSKKNILILPRACQAIKIAKSTLTIKELLKSHNKFLLTEDKKHVFTACLDIFSILDLQPHRAKNLRKDLRERMAARYSIYNSTERIGGNYIIFAENSEKLDSHIFIEDFLSNHRANSLNYYYINYKSTIRRNSK